LNGSQIGARFEEEAPPAPGLLLPLTFPLGLWE